MAEKMTEKMNEKSGKRFFFVVVEPNINGDAMTILKMHRNLYDKSYVIKNKKNKKKKFYKWNMLRPSLSTRAN